MSHQHILGYLVPYHNTYIVKSKRENNGNNNMNMKDKSVRS